MDLLLAEQTLLIALDDAKGRDTAQWAGEAGLAAALLLDLGQSDLLRADGKVLAAVDGVMPAHPVLRDAYDLVRASPRRSAKGWVDRLPRELKPLRDRLARGLVECGILSEQHSRMLGLFPTTRFPEVDPGPERELRQRLADVLVGGRMPSDEEALLVGLLEPLGLIDRAVPGHARRAARRKAKEIGAPGLAGTAVRDVVREVQAAIGVAAVVPAAFS